MYIKFNTKKNEGITLISLVITIVIMLILAAVSISFLGGDYGILTKATEARNMWNERVAQEERELEKIFEEDNGSGTDNPGTDDPGTDDPGTDDPGTDDPGTDDPGTDAPGIVNDAGYLINDYTYVSTSNSALKITIPQGFALMNAAGTSKLTTEAEYEALLTDSNINNGIVVQAKDESEFVWIPITNTGTTGDNNMYWVSNDANVGQLYANDSGNKFGTKRTQYSTNGGLSEPSTIESDGTKSNTITAGNSTTLLTQFQAEFNTMLNSVKRYGGFYVGRYETSVQSGKIKSVKTTDTSQILNAGRADSLGWYGLYNNAKKYVTDAEISNATSCMIWGCAYDQIMLWMQDTITVTDTSGAKGNFGTNPINTGSVNTYSIKKIYDLCGNYQEWTMECMWTSGRAARGGSYKTISSDFKSISSRENRATGSQSDITTRIQLFININD